MGYTSRTRKETDMGTVETTERDSRKISFEDLHRELFGGFDRSDQVSSSNGRTFEIFSMYQPRRLTYSANSREE